MANLELSFNAHFFTQFIRVPIAYKDTHAPQPRAGVYMKRNKKLCSCSAGIQEVPPGRVSAKSKQHLKAPRSPKPG